MRKIIIFCSILCSTPLWAVDADFSKSFVVPERSGINTVTIAGIDAIDSSFSVDFSLNEDLTLSITSAVIQDSLSEILEQNLRNTVWHGAYIIGGDEFETTLNLVVVQNGYIGGEIIHSRSNEDGSAFLHARVTGDIVTQYKINGVFLDEDRITAETLNNLTELTPNRQLIRIKRMRALEFRHDTDGSRWGANREYWLILENGVLTGTVGTPQNIYGTGDTTSENGTLELLQQ